MRLSFLTAVIASCFTSGAAMAATLGCGNAQNQVQNCGFETGDFTDWTISGNAAVLAQTNLYGVDATNPNSGTYEAYFGTQGANVGAHLATDSLTLTQNIPLTESLSYQISFFLMQDTPITPGYTNYFAATFDSSTLLSETAAAVTGGYVLETFTVTGSATGANTLSFASQNDSGFWYIDDVSVIELPEPAGAGVFGLGLLALCTVYKGRKAVLFWKKEPKNF